MADRRSQPQAKRAQAPRRKAGSGGGGTAGSRKARRRRAAAPRPRGLFGWIAYGVRLVFRIIWGLIWRGAVAVMLILAAATGYYYMQLPEEVGAVATPGRADPSRCWIATAMSLPGAANSSAG
ncbi:Peptidoglycan glycosyltransferase [Roseibacterium elongatum DSM 19469]|uniref:Peptidoglycan glycosyltransferase n=1 Tax=Roseicyclus elongatus DSM 19469 TaxID=1294273 RepID=W8RRQ8_9RHOB|nr:Peptidoglycan glycosyltransferase [Roseibacterium elongatum DSM 19469]